MSTPEFLLLAAELDPADVKPGWLGLAVVAGMGVMLALLLWSFSRHIRKVETDEEVWPGDRYNAAGRQLPIRRTIPSAHEEPDSDSRTE